MPSNKDFKRLVRARMSKTGESYTTARARLLEKKATAMPGDGVDPEPSTDLLPDGYEQLAGMSDEAVRSRTGRSWPEWVAELDSLDAAELPHREIARRILDEHDQASRWWAQMITVGYERLRGLRERGQRRDGTFDANRSRTFPVPVARLYAAFADETEREAWLPGIDLTIRTATENRSTRITWPDGTSVAAHFTAKSEEKSSVAVQHGKLPDREAATAARAYWGERLAALASRLAGEPS